MYSVHRVIEFVEGDIFDADVDALVNPVNCKGVSGAGLAKQFKKRFPENQKVYEKIAKNGELHLGDVLVYHDYDMPTGAEQRIIINFPTKDHWKDESYIETISDGMDVLRGAIAAYDIESIAIPPLGCGLGGLDWVYVKPVIVGALSNSMIRRVLVYENDDV